MNKNRFVAKSGWGKMLYTPRGPFVHSFVFMLAISILTSELSGSSKTTICPSFAATIIICGPVGFLGFGANTALFGPLNVPTPSSTNPTGNPDTELFISVTATYVTMTTSTFCSGSILLLFNGGYVRVLLQ